MGVAADVARSARAGADFVQRLFHRLDHRRVLAHAEIVVRAPHGDRLGAVAAEAMRVREGALGPQDVDEHAIAAFVMKPLDRRSEDAVVIQANPRLPAPLAATPKQCHCEKTTLDLERLYLAKAVVREGV